jgi:hypothetical protein
MAEGRATLTGRATPTPGPHPSSSDIVYLVHALARTTLSMRFIGRYLTHCGFVTRYWRYYSTRHPAEHHASLLRTELESVTRNSPETRIHFVTHSMGGIVVRAALTPEAPTNTGRVVMIAPPNRGSHSARRFAPYAAWLWKPLPQLSCEPDSYVCRLPTPAGVEIGVIAGAHDRRVTVEQTHLAGETDHLIVSAGHTFIINRADVCRQTACFLKEGRFSAT